MIKQLVAWYTHSVFSQAHNRLCILLLILKERRVLPWAVSCETSYYFKICFVSAHLQQYRMGCVKEMGKSSRSTHDQCAFLGDTDAHKSFVSDAGLMFPIRCSAVWFERGSLCLNDNRSLFFSCCQAITFRLLSAPSESW